MVASSTEVSMDGTTVRPHIKNSRVVSGMMWKDEDKSWNCGVCGKISKSKTDITRHVEGLHLDHPGFKCDLCGEVVKSRNALRQHKSNRHGPGAFY